MQYCTYYGDDFTVECPTGSGQDDPHWRDCLQFFEYFHGDNGAGLGANHQICWTGVIARLMHLFATLKPEAILEGGKKAYFETKAEPATAIPAGAP